MQRGVLSGVRHLPLDMYCALANVHVLRAASSPSQWANPRILTRCVVACKYSFACVFLFFSSRLCITHEAERARPDPNEAGRRSTLPGEKASTSAAADRKRTTKRMLVPKRETNELPPCQSTIHSRAKMVVMKLSRFFIDHRP